MHQKPSEACTLVLLLLSLSARQKKLAEDRPLPTDGFCRMNHDVMLASWQLQELPSTTTKKKQEVWTDLLGIVCAVVKAVRAIHHRMAFWITKCWWVGNGKEKKTYEKRNSSLRPGVHSIMNLPESRDEVLSLNYNWTPGVRAYYYMGGWSGHRARRRHNSSRDSPTSDMWILFRPSATSRAANTIRHRRLRT